MGRGRTHKVLTTQVDVPAGTRGPDELIVEEPLSIHLDGTLVATTMRTPGDDFELAVGFCHAEGLLGGAPVQRCRYCATGTAGDTGYNVVTVETGGRAPTPTPRLGGTTSSCGLCGSTEIDALVSRLHPFAGPPPIDAEVLAGVPGAVRDLQDLFGRTGAVHAAAAFDGEGRPVLVREDIGRHNAVDKVVGRLLLDGRLPAGDLGLFVSGRASFEMVQKAWAAGFPLVIAVSAPSALAVEVARRANMALLGFARDGRFNVYAPD